MLEIKAIRPFLGKELDLFFVYQIISSHCTALREDLRQKGAEHCCNDEPATTLHEYNMKSLSYLYTEDSSYYPLVQALRAVTDF